MKDMKEALGSGLKPDITHVRKPIMVYSSRAGEYGSDKYERANYLRPVDGPRAAFERYRAYLRATIGHLVDNLDAMEKHQALDPHLEDVEGMKRAAYAADNTPGKGFPASGLPHAAHAAASLNMALAQAVDAGLLPADPGQPWRDAPAAVEIRDCTFEIEPTAPLAPAAETLDLGEVSRSSATVPSNDATEHLRRWRESRGLCRICGKKLPAYNGGIWCDYCEESDK